MNRDHIRVSVVIPVLDSHEILRRQLLYFEKMNLPNDVEIIIVDDGSNPPLEYIPSENPLQLTILRTNDTRPWTWALARNKGAKYAAGEWLILYDLDHIISLDLVEMVRNYDGQKIQFKREYGVILEDGTFTQDLDVLEEWGWPRSRYRTKGVRMPAHPNMFAMKKEIFFALGGYQENLLHKPYPAGEDRRFKKMWIKWVEAGKGNVHTERPVIYMFPNGKSCGDGHVDYDAKGLFHKLTRASENNYYHRRYRKWEKERQK
jgi:glycosyltransferase involved in cell wall biosynthesis